MGSKRTCENSGYNIKEQFPEVGKLSKRNSGVGVRIKDNKLSGVKNLDKRVIKDFITEKLLMILPKENT